MKLNLELSSDDLVNKIAERLPEFTGYNKLDARKENDSSIRQSLVKELTFAVNIFAKQLNDSSRIGEAKRIVGNTVLSKFRSLHESIESQLQNETFFETDGIEDADLEIVLTQDLNLVTKAIALKEKTIRVSREIIAAPSWDAEVDELYGKLKDLSAAWERRERLVRSIGNN